MEKKEMSEVGTRRKIWLRTIVVIHRMFKGGHLH